MLLAGREAFLHGLHQILLLAAIVAFAGAVAVRAPDPHARARRPALAGLGRAQRKRGVSVATLAGIRVISTRLVMRPS